MAVRQCQTMGWPATSKRGCHTYQLLFSNMSEDLYYLWQIKRQRSESCPSGRTSDLFSPCQHRFANSQWFSLPKWQPLSQHVRHWPFLCEESEETSLLIFQLYFSVRLTLVEKNTNDLRNILTVHAAILRLAAPSPDRDICTTWGSHDGISIWLPISSNLIPNLSYWINCCIMAVSSSSCWTIFQSTSKIPILEVFEAVDFLDFQVYFSLASQVQVGLWWLSKCEIDWTIRAVSWAGGLPSRSKFCHTSVWMYQSFWNNGDSRKPNINDLYSDT